jgi:hypothetical protein
MPPRDKSSPNSVSMANSVVLHEALKNNHMQVDSPRARVPPTRCHKPRATQDIGRILLGVQDELKNIRASLVDVKGPANGVGSGSSRDSALKSNMANFEVRRRRRRRRRRRVFERAGAMQEVLERAEADLRAKTDAVLSVTLNQPMSTLPALRSGREHSRGPPGLPSVGAMMSTAPPPYQSRMTVKDQLLEARHHGMVTNPTKSHSSRLYLEQKYGIQARLRVAPMPLRSFHASLRSTHGYAHSALNQPTRARVPARTTPDTHMHSHDPPHARARAHTHTHTHTPTHTHYPSSAGAHTSRARTHTSERALPHRRRRSRRVCGRWVGGPTTGV